MSASSDNGHDSDRDSSCSEDLPFLVVLSHKGTHTKLHYPSDATVEDVFLEASETLSIPQSSLKLIVPKGPLVKHPLKEPERSIDFMHQKTIMVMGSSVEQIQAVQEMSRKVAQRNAAQHEAKSRLRSVARRNRTTSAADAKYTFMQIKPLQSLPHPERSHKLLTRLAEDPGIRSVMRKRKFTVALLTEMEPLAHTESTHEGTSRTLGLNRNKGEVIELRLRTDAHDGYRDYKTIRKTLCHELTHNVHSDHDQKFWDLCHQIEREVDAADWKSSGHTIGETSRYTISGRDQEDDVVEDHRGWTGGRFVLGGVEPDQAPGLSRREVLAQAALERQRKDDECERRADCGWKPCQRSRSGSNDGESS